MKVKDLIKKLQECDPEAVVLVTSSNFELNGSDMPVRYISESNEGKKFKKTFRDGFDGGTYQKEVWSTMTGRLKVIKLSA